MINLNELRDRAYKCAQDHGFHDKEYSDEHFLMLTITELSEGVEADRKGKHADKIMFENLQETQPEIWDWNFKYCIKDSVEDELSDAFIRLLDLYGLKERFLDESGFDEENILDYASVYENKSFTEGVYCITGLLADRNHSITESCVLPEILLLEILGFAKHLDIDLDWYIEQKMKYNELREPMHGKKY